MRFYSEEIEKIYDFFNTTNKGLSSVEASSRLKNNGENVLPKAKESGFIIILFKLMVDPLVAILIFTAILSFISKEITDAIIILFIIFFNSLLGAFQEHRAGKKAKALQNMIKVSTKVLRDGKEIIVDSSGLVVGDIVFFESGTKVSADIRLVSSVNLSIDESILTGESLPSSKNLNILDNEVDLALQDNMLFAGTSVLSGRGMGIVVATGINTEIGKIASKVILTKDTKSPLVIRMEKLTKQIAKATAILSVLIFFILYQKGLAPDYIFHLVVALAVSAIPEGLPIALTFSLSIASSRMAKRNVLVKKLNSVESLGSCTIIASDKTGTLTMNEQTAKIIVLPNGSKYNISGIGYNHDGSVDCPDNKIIELGVINNEASLNLEEDIWKKTGDSVDVAFLALGYKAKVTSDIRKSVFGVLHYESEKKYSAAFYDKENPKCTIKGSVEIVTSFCSKMEVDGKIENINLEIISKQADELAANGYRVIALAYNEYNGKKETEFSELDIPSMIFSGLVGFIDPIRKDALLAIDSCHKAGIKVVMITGDHPLTAFAIAKELDFASSMEQVATSSELQSYFEKGEVEFDSFIKNKTVFSRVTPIQKLDIVEAYKRMGEFVAVTGDGVNDAPALKAANIGIAVGSGTDVAKETGTMIITDDNFMSIVAGIEEGRIAYNNVRKVVYMLLSTGIAELMFFVLAIIFNYPPPLLAVQILWLNIVTNGIQDISLSFEKGEDGLMRKKPRSPKENIFDKKLITETLLSSFVIAIIVFLTWAYLIESSFDEKVARTYVLLLMVLIQNIHVFNCRSEENSIFKLKFISNPIIYIGIFASLLINFLIINTDLNFILKVTSVDLFTTFILVLLAIPIIIVMEIYKYFSKKELKKLHLTL